MIKNFTKIEKVDNKVKDIANKIRFSFKYQ